MRTQLSQILVENYNLNEDILAEAQRVREEKGGNIGDILVQQKGISETQLLDALSNQFELPYWPILPLENIESEFIAKVPIQFLKKYFMVPLEYEKPITAANCGLSSHTGTDADKQVAPPGYVIAINDPLNFHALDDLVRLIGIADFKLVLAGRETILSAINLQYDLRRDSAEELVQNMEENGSDILSEIEETADLLDDTSEAPIIKL
ncbi:MAG: type II secretion system protein GspE, partial [Desulfobacterales bacterium]